MIPFEKYTLIDEDKYGRLGYPLGAALAKFKEFSPKNLPNHGPYYGLSADLGQIIATMEQDDGPLLLELFEDLHSWGLAQVAALHFTSLMHVVTNSKFPFEVRRKNLHRVFEDLLPLYSGHLPTDVELLADDRPRWPRA